MGNRLLSPSLRRLNLTAHVGFSVGWFGSVAFFLVLAIRGLNAQDADSLKGMYLAMEAGAMMVIVPACIGSLVTGIGQSVGTQWGLFKYYWVSTKLLLTIAGTLLLLVHLDPINFMASAVTGSDFKVTDQDHLRLRLVIDAVAASAILLFALVLSVFKPWGKIDLSRLRFNRKSLFIAITVLLIVVVLHTFLKH